MSSRFSPSLLDTTNIFIEILEKIRYNGPDAVSTEGTLSTFYAGTFLQILRQNMNQCIEELRSQTSPARKLFVSSVMLSLQLLIFADGKV